MGNYMNNYKMPEQATITRKDKCNIFFSGILVPTERAFRGYLILLSIWTVGTFLAIGMITALTKAHTNALEKPDNAEILDRLDDLQDVMITTGAVFAALAFVSQFSRLSTEAL